MGEDTTMKHLCLIIIIAFVLSGCAAWREYKRDYLKAEEYQADTLPNAYKDLKDHYLQ
jgi:PBP1b-binding outer membrane lipoprotein LpoB